jgi:hypothetical protein
MHGGQERRRVVEAQEEAEESTRLRETKRVVNCDFTESDWFKHVTGQLLKKDGAMSEKGIGQLAFRRRR